MIELKHVTKAYEDPRGGVVEAVKNVDLTVHDGETVCLIGPSGCGKTTTLKMINRLIEPTRGQVLIEGVDVQQYAVIALRRRIGYVIQTGGLFPHMTVAENIGLLCTIEGWSTEKKRKRVDELLDIVNLPPEDFRTRYPGELSGGQRQRVGVARALALDPPYLLMDEPFGALDPITRSQVQEEFRQLKNRVKKTTVTVTHDMAEAFLLGDRVALMDEGSVIQIGTEDDFRHQPATQFVTDFLQSHLHNGGDHA